MVDKLQSTGPVRLYKEKRYKGDAWFSLWWDNKIWFVGRLDIPWIADICAMLCCIWREKSGRRVDGAGGEGEGMWGGWIWEEGREEKL